MSGLIQYQTPPQNLIDSAAVVCPVGVYTTLIPDVPQNTKWVQLKIIAVLAGELQIAVGAAAAEVNKLHWSYGVKADTDIGNVPFRFNKGVRISLNPDSQVTAEIHLYY